MAKTKGICLVIGAGEDTGGAISRAFSRDGYHVCMTRRPRNLETLEAQAKAICDDGGSASAHGVDARDEDAMAAFIAEIERDRGPIEVAVYNIGANVKFGIAETTPRVFRKVWEMATYGGFLMAHNVTPFMKERGRGTMLFTGATASVRGSAGFSAFASAKHGLRALAQSCARELGPKNIHVAHVIVDGMIDSKFIRQNFSDADEWRDDDKILSPDAIAANYVHLHHQPRNAWTFELDLRPYAEKW